MQHPQICERCGRRLPAIFSPCPKCEQLRLDLSEPAFVCQVDESGGVADDYRYSQLTELPGTTFEDLFVRPGDAA